MQSYVPITFSKLDSQNKFNEVNLLDESNADANNKSSLTDLKPNGIVSQDHITNGNSKKTLSFIRKFVKATGAPLHQKSNPVDEAILEYKPDNVRPQTFTVDNEVNHRKFAVDSLQGIYDPLCIGPDEIISDPYLKVSVWDVCGESNPSENEYHCQILDPPNLKESYSKSSDIRTTDYCDAFEYVCQVKGCKCNKILPKITKKTVQCVCQYCNKLCENEEQLSEHMYRHSTSPFICDRCGSVFDSQESLSDHEKHHGDSVPCTRCNSICDDAVALQVHLNIKPMPIECESCDGTCSSLCDLQLHQAMCKKTKSYSCKECGKIFSGGARLEDHYRLHALDRPFLCEYCSIRYTNRQHLLRHQRVNMIFKNGVPVIFECGKCTSKFESKCGLRRHYVLDHHESLPEDYQKKIIVATPATSHDRILRTRLLNYNENQLSDFVSGDNYFTCEQCNQIFESRPGMIRHQQAKHDNNTRPYQCKQCPKSFSHQASVSKHIHQNHTTGGVFVCRICKRLFSEQGQIERHKQWHKCATFECLTCGIMYSCAKHLYRHLTKFTDHKVSDEFMRIVETGSYYKNNAQTLPSLDRCTYDNKDKVHQFYPNVEINGEGVNPLATSGNYMTYAQLMKFFEGKVKPFVCMVCGKHWPSRINCVEHYMTHSKEKPFRCRRCGQGFIRKRKLDEHVLQFHMIGDAEDPIISEDEKLRKDSYIQECENMEDFDLDGRPDFNPNMLSRYSHLNLIIPSVRLNRYNSQSLRGGRNDSDCVFECDKCRRIFVKNSSLRWHKRSCGITKNKRCSLPKARKSTPFTHMKTYEEIDRIVIYGIEHWISREKGMLEYICGMCKRSFDKKNFIFKHTLVHIANKPFKCTLCPSRGFMTRKSMRKHFRINHELAASPWVEKKRTLPTVRKIQTIDLTKIVTNKKQNIHEQRAKVNHGSKSPEQITVECDLNDIIDLEEPDITTSKEEEFYSQNYQVQDQYLAQYEQITETAPSVEIPVNYVLLNFDLENVPMNHFLECTGVPDPLETAVQPSAQTFTLEDEEIIKEEASEINLTCAQCNTPFENRHDLFQHYSKHDVSNDPLKCFICRKEFTKRQYLQKHAMMHTRARLFQCSYCTKSFRNSRDMNDHIRMHTGEKPFMCEQCNSRFRTRKQLQIHHRIHTGDKRYQCGNCSSSFNIYKTLKRHEKNCLNNKPDQKQIMLNSTVHDEMSKQLENLICSQLNRKIETELYSKDEIFPTKRFLECDFYHSSSAVDFKLEPTHEEIVLDDW